MWFELHIPQPSTVALEEHINHPSTLEAINHLVEAFVYGCNTQRCTHIMHLRPHLIFLCLEWPWCTWDLSDACSPEGHVQTEDLETEHLEDNQDSTLDQGLRPNQWNGSFTVSFWQSKYVFTPKGIQILKQLRGKSWEKKRKTAIEGEKCNK